MYENEKRRKNSFFKKITTCSNIPKILKIGFLTTQNIFLNFRFQTWNSTVRYPTDCNISEKCAISSIQRPWNYQVLMN